MPRGLFQRFINIESGQGISEYGAIIAFVAMLVALTFSLSSGHLASALSNAFSAVISEMDGMSSAAS